MSGHSKLPRASALQILGALSLLFLAVDTRAMTASPSPSYDGNYTVSWSTTLGCTYNDDPPFYSYQCYSLWENGVEIGASGYSLPVTGKPEGSYEYLVYYVLYVYGNPYDGYVVEGPVNVTVGTPPPRDPIPTQLNYQFQTRQGDINYDGRTDLFVQRSSGGVSGNGVLDSVILQQNASGGTFSPVADAYYSSIASGWPLSSATPVITDFNVDGYVDVEVKGVAAATGTSADDQIVFSSGVPLQAQPLGLRAVDASLTQFVGNSLDYVVNPNYFSENVPTAYFSGTYYRFYCWFMPNPYGFINDYYWGDWSCQLYEFYYSGYYQNYSVFSAESVAIWTNVKAFEAGTVSGAQSTERAQQAAEGVMGVQIGGWPMEEVLGTSGEHTDADVRRSLEIFWAILGIARENWQEVETEEAPEQAPRDNMDTIYITARPVLHTGWYHTALEYVPQFAPPEIPIHQTISATDDDEGAADGTLVAHTNLAVDLPFLMMTLGSAHRQGVTNFSYWTGDLIPAHNHYRNLPYAQQLQYDAFPEFPMPPTPGADGYNSNGYISGILDATNGTAYIDFFGTSVLPGWPTRVPAAYFGL